MRQEGKCLQSINKAVDDFVPGRSIGSRLSRRAKYLTSRRIGPAIGGFKQAHLLQSEMIAVAIPVGRVKYTERGEREIFRCGWYIQHNCLVSIKRLKKFHYWHVVRIGQECVIPFIYQNSAGDTFYFRIIHHHALLGGACLSDNVT